MHAHLLGHPLTFATARGLFSADRVDDGTLLLLQHLPERAPANVLDLGCGYGALGLAIAAKYREANVTMCDRDLLAVHFAQLNATRNGLTNAHAHGSLGLRDIPADAHFDWIVCNVPARIGPAALQYFLQACAARATPNGAFRIVVIRDLEEPVRTAATKASLELSHVATGARHHIFAITPREANVTDHESCYLRDKVALGELQLDRPTDVDDARELREAWQMFTEFFPKRIPGRALVVPARYGFLPIEAERRGARVTAVDRDLLNVTFAKRNLAAAGYADAEVQALSPFELHSLQAPFDFVAAELLSEDEPSVSEATIKGVLSKLAPKGDALWLFHKNHAREAEKLGLRPLATRSRYVVAHADRNLK